MIAKNRLLPVLAASLVLSISGARAADPTPMPNVSASTGEAETKPVPLPQASTQKPTDKKYESLELFQRVLSYIEENYVEGVDDQKLMEGAIKGMMDTLDPHSNYLPPEIFRDMKSDTSGKFGGLGLEIGVKDGAITVIAPMEDSPAWRAGIQAGDRITKINGQATRGLNLVDTVNRMRGSKGSSIRLTIYREGTKKAREVKLTRETIKIQTVKGQMLDDGIGYVKLASFNEDAAKDVQKAIEKLETKGKLKGLVFDLRMNPGGLLDQAVDVTSLFLDGGVVVSTKGRAKESKEIRYARKGRARTDLPLAVLVNSGSASASEIVAGALQDHKRALILGQTTFGKGSVQQVVELGKERGMKLTIARYYTPSGRSIQEMGVKPDVSLEDYDPKLLAQAKRKADPFRERDLRGHMANQDTPLGDSDAVPDEDVPTTLFPVEKKKEEFEPQRFKPQEDYQVREAVAHLKSFEFYRTLSQAGPETKATASH